MSKLKLNDDHFLNFLENGDRQNPTVIFSNSLGSDLTMWDPQVEFFKNDYHIIRYDKRGHGKSSPIEGPYTFEMLEEDVIKILDETNIEKAHFVGLSMGGMTSLGLALKYPTRFNKFICCAARADMPSAAIEGWDQRMEIVKNNGTSGVVNGSMERWFSKNFRDNKSNNQILNKAKKMIEHTSVNGYLGSCDAIKKLNYLKELHRIKNDFLFISGENDVGAPALAMEEMHHLTKNSQYICISGVAHVFNLEKPDETNLHIKKFLS